LDDQKQFKYLKSHIISKGEAHYLEEEDKFDENMFKQNLKKYVPKLEDLRSMDKNSLEYQINVTFARKRGSKSHRKLSRIPTNSQVQNIRVETPQHASNATLPNMKNSMESIEVLQKATYRAEDPLKPSVLKQLKLQKEQEAFQKRMESYK
jgi:hypothetical protein